MSNEERAREAGVDPYNIELALEQYGGNAVPFEHVKQIVFAAESRAIDRVADRADRLLLALDAKCDCFTDAAHTGEMRECLAETIRGLKK